MVNLKDLSTTELTRKKIEFALYSTIEERLEYFDTALCLNAIEEQVTKINKTVTEKLPGARKDMDDRRKLLIAYILHCDKDHQGFPKDTDAISALFAVFQDHCVHYGKLESALKQSKAVIDSIAGLSILKSNQEEIDMLHILEKLNKFNPKSKENEESNDTTKN